MEKRAWETLEPELIERFLDSRSKLGDQTLKVYRRNLMNLYDYLPEEKRLTEKTGHAWKAWMEKQGISARSINNHLSVLNSLYEYLGRREFQTQEYMESDEVIQPELTRTEYLRLLQAARTLEKERTFLLIKTLGGAGFRVQELPQLTVQAVNTGSVELITHNGKRRRICRLPPGLCRELAAYTAREGIQSGPVFRDTGGKALVRTSVNRLIQDVCQTAQVDMEKATPRCLWNMYLGMQAMLQSSMLLLVEQAYNRIMEQEQQQAGWVG